jgi:hypothetical protein
MHELVVGSNIDLPQLVAEPQGCETTKDVMRITTKWREQVS